MVRILNELKNRPVKDFCPQYRREIELPGMFIWKSYKMEVSNFKRLIGKIQHNVENGYMRINFYRKMDDVTPILTVEEDLDSTVKSEVDIAVDIPLPVVEYELRNTDEVTKGAILFVAAQRGG